MQAIKVDFHLHESALIGYLGIAKQSMNNHAQK